MREARRVRVFLQGLVMLNLVILTGLFLGPRFLFILEHRGMSHSEFLQTQGTFDLPNLFTQSYELAFALKEATPESATLFLPSVNGPHTKNSVLLQVLRPRRLEFQKGPEGSAGGERGSHPDVWIVFKPQSRPEGCRGRGSRSLGNTGYVICRARD